MKQPLIKKLDYVFKRYVRLKATQRNGYTYCVSCGVYKPFAELDAGHFINCKWLPTRWREDNVHPQCRFCNRFDEGNKPGYALFMLKTYGEKHVEYLQALSRERAGYSDNDGLFMIADYKDKLKALTQ